MLNELKKIKEKIDSSEKRIDKNSNRNIIISAITIVIMMPLPLLTISFLMSNQYVYFLLITIVIFICSLIIYHIFKKEQKRSLIHRRNIKRNKIMKSLIIFSKKIIKEKNENIDDLLNDYDLNFNYKKTIKKGFYYYNFKNQNQLDKETKKLKKLKNEKYFKYDFIFTIILFSGLLSLPVSFVIMIETFDGFFGANFIKMFFILIVSFSFFVIGLKKGTHEQKILECEYNITKLIMEKKIVKNLEKKVIKNYEEEKSAIKLTNS